jgi:hypothetical protein
LVTSVWFYQYFSPNLLFRIGESELFDITSIHCSTRFDFFTKSFHALFLRLFDSFLFVTMEAFSLVGSTLTASPERIFGYAATLLLGVMAVKNTFLKVVPPPAVVQVPFMVAAAVPDPLELMTRAIVLTDACLLNCFNLQLGEMIAGMAQVFPATLKGFEFLGGTPIHGSTPDNAAMRSLLVMIWNNKGNRGLAILLTGIHGDGKVWQFVRRLPRLLKSIGFADTRAARAIPDSVIHFKFAGVGIDGYGITRGAPTTEKLKDAYFEFLTCRSDTYWPIAFATIVYHACAHAGVYTFEQCCYMAVAKTIQCIGLSYGILPAQRNVGCTPVNLGVPAVTFP